MSNGDDISSDLSAVHMGRACLVRSGSKGDWAVATTAMEETFGSSYIDVTSN